MTPIIDGIFPTPIVRSKLEFFTAQEKQFFSDQEKTVTKNFGNRRSTNLEILSAPQMQRINTEVMNILKFYMENIICTNDDVTPYITQSWLNFINPNEFHHIHNHPNSFISGVIYIQTQPDIDKIFFEKERGPEIICDSKELNFFNTQSWFFPVDVGDIILFPSSLKHYVQGTETHQRISLAFNSFLHGTLCKTSYLAKLTV